MRWIIIAFLALTASLHAQGVMPWAFVRAPATTSPLTILQPDSIVEWRVAADLIDSLGHSDGDTVHEWRNRARWFAPFPMEPYYQLTEAKKPIIKGDSNVLVFDGADDGMSCITPRYNQPASMITIVRPYGAGTTYFHDGVNSSGRQVMNQTAAQWGFYGGTAFIYRTPKPNSDSIYVLVASANGASSYLRVNGFPITGDAGSGPLIGRTVGARNTLAADFWQGGVREVLYYHKTFSAQELEDIEKYYFELYGVAARYTNNYVFDGNSLTAGNHNPVGSSYPDGVDSIYNVPEYQFTNLGVGGQTLVQMASDTTTQVDIQQKPTCNNYLIWWGGTNDLVTQDSTTVIARLQQYGIGRKYSGWDKTFVLTILPINDATHNANREGVNRWLRANYTQIADVLVDVAADPRIGDFGDQADTTYYQSDQVHLTGEGNNIISEAVYNALIANP